MSTKSAAPAVVVTPKSLLREFTNRQRQRAKAYVTLDGGFNAYKKAHGADQVGIDSLC
jgi:hypothetical protein